MVHHVECISVVDDHSSFFWRFQGSSSFDSLNFNTEFVPTPDFSARGTMHNNNNSGFSTFFKKKIKA